MSNGAEVAVTSGEILRQQVGGWLPSDQRALDAWVASVTRKVELAEPAELHPVILEFQELIATVWGTQTRFTRQGCIRG